MNLCPVQETNHFKLGIRINPWQLRNGPAYFLEFWITLRNSGREMKPAPVYSQPETVMLEKEVQFSLFIC